MNGTEAKIDPEELEKALDNALDESLEKAAKKAPKKAEDSEKPEPEEDEEKEEGYSKEENKEMYNKSEDEPDFESLSKSIPDAIKENEDAAEVVDAMPFVKALVDTVEDQMVALTKAVVYLSDKIESIQEIVDNSDKIGRAEAKLVKSISERINTISETPLPRKAFLGKNITIMKKSEDGEKEIELTKSEALEGLTELCKSGKIQVKDIVKYESYINNGRELPESVTQLIASTKK